MRLPEKIETEREIDGWYQVQRRDDELISELVEKFNKLIECLEEILPGESKEV